MSHRPLTKLLQSQLPQCRPFTRTSIFASPAPPRKPAVSRPSPAKKSPSPPARRTVSKPIAPPPVLFRTPKSNNAFVAPKVPISRFRGVADNLLGQSISLCLYKAPPHTGLIFGSYIVGGGLFGYSYSLASLLQMGTVPWYATAVLVSGCTMVSAFAMAMWLTPLKLLKRVTLLRDADRNPYLRFEGRKPWKPWATKVMESKCEHVFVNKDVPGMLTQWDSVPMANAQAWTRDEPLESGLRDGSKAPGLFEGPRNAVAKMFWREGMVYVRIGDQNWKMDLVRCELLENGAPFMKLVEEDHGIRHGLLSLARKYAKVFM